MRGQRLSIVIDDTRELLSDERLEFVVVSIYFLEVHQDALHDDRVDDCVFFDLIVVCFG